MKNLLCFLLSAVCFSACAGADWYLNSASGSDANSGADWDNAKLTLTNVVALMAAGDTCYATNTHRNAIAAGTILTIPGTAAQPCYFISVSDSGVPPTTFSSGATFATSGSSSLTIGAGYAFWFGWRFQAGTNTASTANLTVGSANPGFHVFEGCQLEVRGTGASSVLAIGVAGTIDDGGAILRNTNLRFGNTGQKVNLLANFSWLSGSVDDTGSAPTTLLNPQNDAAGAAVLQGVDLSHLGSATVLSVAGAAQYSVQILDCTLGASAVLTSGAVAGQGGIVCRVGNSDSTAANYRYHLQTFAGTITHETTNIRTNGSTDGTTPISRKLVTTANSSFIFPLETDAMTFWNEVTNSQQTVTLQVMTDGVVLSNTLAWLSVDYLGQSATPLSSNVTSRAATILTAPSVLTTNSAGAWNTNGIVAPVWQQMSVTFTPQMKGLVHAKICLARPSTTMYVDHLALTPSARQYQGATSYINEGSRQTAIGSAR